MELEQDNYHPDDVPHWTHKDGQEAMARFGWNLLFGGTTFYGIFTAGIQGKDYAQRVQKALAHICANAETEPLCAKAGRILTALKLQGHPITANASVQERTYG